MEYVRRFAVLVVCSVLLAGCGGDDEVSQPAQATATATPSPEPTGTASPDPTAEPEPEPAATKAPERGTKVTLRESAFGQVLFDGKGQAIYIFELDGKGDSVCYGQCAKDWPPVFTDGDPVAGDGVRKRLLGTTKRRDGRLQVTYAGQPLYFYANESPGEVRCHNVNLNGGLWWVLGANGSRRP